MRIVVSAVLASALLALGCGGTEPAPTGSTREPTTGGQPASQPVGGSVAAGGGMGGPGMMMPAADCPMNVAAARVEASDVEGGAALTFTTDSPERVEDLRLRTRRMAEHIQMHHGGPPLGPGRGRGMGRGMGPGPMMMMPPAHATVTDVEGGARIELHALDAADVDALRASVRQHEDHMRAGACPMMMQGTTTG